LTSEARGEIELDNNILVVRRIHVTYHLKLDPDKREKAERVHTIHAKFCPVARTIQDCVEISTSLEMEEL
jgi:uncharacterized OsmC-like protein